MTDERKDPPIEEMPFVSGMTVVDFGDVRVARGLSRRPFSGCKHKRLRYDTRERRIWCADCERDIEGFEAFALLAERAHEVDTRLKAWAEEVKAAEAFQLRSRAAKKIDEVWRGRSLVPCCPHCNRGLLPEHFANGITNSVGYEFAKRQNEKAKP